MAKIDRFEMERYQSLHWHEVEHDLSESGVSPLTVRALLGPYADAEIFMQTALGYPLSEGSPEARHHIAEWYPDAGPENVTVMNGGSEANLLALWSLLGSGDRLAFMIPNYLQGLGLGPVFGKGVDTFRLRVQDGRWALDLESLERAVGPTTKVVMVCNPNNPTGAVLTEAEMEAVIQVAARRGAWIVADEIYRGAEVDSDITSPTFWGRYDKVVITSGLSKAFGMPGLRVGWAVSTPAMIAKIWERHDYTTLTPGMISDKLAAFTMHPDVRENVFARTRGIIRANLPRLEDWIARHPYFDYVRPVAGAIAYVRYRLPVRSSDLVERIREEQSVLLVAGDMFGLKKGIRIGFGYDIEATLRGLARADVTLAAVAGMDEAGPQMEEAPPAEMSSIAAVPDPAPIEEPEQMVQIPPASSDDVRILVSEPDAMADPAPIDRQG
jgi:aspartate/methionine/tyrosine aminotransferase